MGIIHSLKKLKKSWDSYQPLIEVLIYKNDILHNLKQFQTSFPKMQFAPVLKSNAYGHGLVEVAQILDNKALPFFMVDSLFEARILRNVGIKTPLLILGYVTAENINSQKLKDVAFAVISLEQLKSINKNLKRSAVFHLKIDTGMRRQGLMPEEIGTAIKIFKNNKLISLGGICSHLADADSSSLEFSEKQIKLWNELSAQIQNDLGQIKYLHLTNTAGSDLNEKVNVNVGRLGLGLYGYNLSPRSALHLRPALEMKSIISSIRTLKQGEEIGYNATFKAQHEIKTATVPVGYTEGLDRRLSNKGAMIVNGKTCPILGRVSMNMSSIDISNVSDARLEQPVLAISKNPGDPNSPENMAQICNSIVYEILVKIPASLKRTVI